VHEPRAEPGFKITVNGISLTGMSLPSLEAGQVTVTGVTLREGGTFRDAAKHGIKVADGSPDDAKPTTPDPEPK
jgi:hypothetical protein